ncbi:hypothetical protein QOT17_006385 [Balamuthia mandrillaris]
MSSPPQDTSSAPSDIPTSSTSPSNQRLGKASFSPRFIRSVQDSLSSFEQEFGLSSASIYPSHPDAASALLSSSPDPSSPMPPSTPPSHPSSSTSSFAVPAPRPPKVKAEEMGPSTPSLMKGVQDTPFFHSSDYPTTTIPSQHNGYHTTTTTTRDESQPPYFQAPPPHLSAQLYSSPPPPQQQAEEEQKQQQKEQLQAPEPMTVFDRERQRQMQQRRDKGLRPRKAYEKQGPFELQWKLPSTSMSSSPPQYQGEEEVDSYNNQQYRTTTT